VAWVRALGADEVVDHSRDLAPQLEALGMKEVDYIFCLNNTDRWLPALAPIIKPLGKICTIVSAQKPLDLTPLMGKSTTLAWEFMFTRSTFQTPDMIEQHNLLNETAALVDAGTLKTTLTTHLGKINAANLKRAHKLIEAGHTLGKIALEGF
jgi:NADPH2:quinone reductase